MWRWFTDYTGENWKPRFGYSERFQKEVQTICQRFRLVRTSRTGVVEGTGHQVIYDVPYPPENPSKYVLVAVRIDQFSYWEVVRWGQFQTPVFTFQLSIVRRASRRLLEIFRGDVAVAFPQNYPLSRPQVFIGLDQFEPVPVGGSLAFLMGDHWRNLKRICALNGVGDWKPSQDTALRALEVAINWVVYQDESGKLPPIKGR